MKKSQPAAPDVTEAREIAKQVEVELAILLSIEQSLRLALQWMTHERRNSYKLSTLRFVTRSFERHLTRTRVLADYGGFMHLITDANQHLTGEVGTLREEREALQADFERILLRLEYVSPDDGAALEKVCADLENYLVQLDTHSHKEMDLLQHSFVQEEGGEG